MIRRDQGPRSKVSEDSRYNLIIPVESPGFTLWWLSFSLTAGALAPSLGFGVTLTIMVAANISHLYNRLDYVDGAEKGYGSAPAAFFRSYWGFPEAYFAFVLQLLIFLKIPPIILMAGGLRLLWYFRRENKTEQSSSADLFICQQQCRPTLSSLSLNFQNKP